MTRWRCCSCRRGGTASRPRACASSSRRRRRCACSTAILVLDTEGDLDRVRAWRTGFTLRPLDGPLVDVEHADLVHPDAQVLADPWRFLEIGAEHLRRNPLPAPARWATSLVPVDELPGRARRAVEPRGRRGRRRRRPGDGRRDPHRLAPHRRLAAAVPGHGPAHRPGPRHRRARAVPGRLQRHGRGHLLLRRLRRRRRGPRRGGRRRVRADLRRRRPAAGAPRRVLVGDHVRHRQPPGRERPRALLDPADPTGLPHGRRRVGDHHAVAPPAGIRRRAQLAARTRTGRSASGCASTTRRSPVVEGSWTPPAPRRTR